MKDASRTWKFAKRQNKTDSELCLQPGPPQSTTVPNTLLRVGSSAARVEVVQAPLLVCWGSSRRMTFSLSMATRHWSCLMYRGRRMEHSTGVRLCGVEERYSLKLSIHSVWHVSKVQSCLTHTVWRTEFIRDNTIPVSGCVKWGSGTPCRRLCCQRT